MSTRRRTQERLSLLNEDGGTTRTIWLLTDLVSAANDWLDREVPWPALPEGSEWSVGDEFRIVIDPNRARGLALGRGDRVIRFPQTTPFVPAAREMYRQLVEIFERHCAIYGIELEVREL